MKNKALIRLIAAVLMISLTVAGCTGENKKDAAVMNIAEQYGFAYAPLQIAKELKLIEKNLPGTTVNWKQLGNTAAIREAMLADEIDVGFMAIPPFLIGWDKGMDWKIAFGLSSSPAALVTNREEIKSIRDIGEKDRIALPQPGSIQHILLSMACERELGDAKKLDNLLVTMSHPDGMNALLAGKDITVHFTTPPYLLKELQTQGIHEILDGREAMGKDFTFIAGVTTRRFHDERAREYEALVKAVSEAMEYMKDNHEEAVEILSRQYEMSVDEVERNLSLEGTDYTLAVKGVNEFADFMERNGYISKTPENPGEIIWDEGYYED